MVFQAERRPVSEEEKQMTTHTKCVLARVFPILFFLTLIENPKNEALAFHCNQSLILMIVSIAISLLGMIPILGVVVEIVGGIGVFVFWIMGIMYAARDEMKPFPWIGEFHLIDR